MKKYLAKIQNLTDQLALASEIVSQADIVMHIINGLPSEYGVLATIVRAQSNPISVASLTGLLLAEEIVVDSKIKKQRELSETTIAFSAMHLNPSDTQFPTLFTNHGNTHRGRFSRGSFHHGNSRGGGFRGGNNRNNRGK